MHIRQGPSIRPATADWLSPFVDVIDRHCERLIEEFALYGVGTIVVMEEWKRTTALRRDTT